MNNKPKIRNENGKFMKKNNDGTTQGNDLKRVQRQFIREVKREILNSVFDLDNVKKAYEYIIGSDEPANIIVMRRAILNYTNCSGGNCKNENYE